MNPGAEYDYLLKLIIVGDAGVGKSSMLSRFADDVFEQNYGATIGVDFKFRTVKVCDKTVKLQLWDTAGQERFRTITQSYYRAAHGVIIVFDVTNEASFDSLARWIEDADKYCSDSQVKKIIVGNKCDLHEKREVDFATAAEFASMHHCRYLETSAKEDLRVQNAFFSLSEDCVNSQRMTRPKGPGTIKPSASTPITSGPSCC